MKIFRFFSNISSSESLQMPDWTMKVLPDTAMLIQKRPFFIPDFTEDCKVQLCYAVRINRLGRSIHEKFSHRYYDASAITLGVHFVARDLWIQLQAQGKPVDTAVGFDNAVAVSEIRTDYFDETSSVGLKIDEDLYSYPVDGNLLACINKQIEAISSFYTLKQGDILLFPVAMEELPVAIDNHLSLYMNEHEVLSFNVK